MAFDNSVRTAIINQEILINQLLNEFHKNLIAQKIRKYL